MKRNATAVWNGSLKSGAGVLWTPSKTLENTPYSFESRFEEGAGTNPEELLGAAHAGCFTMQLSAYLGEAGFDVDRIETQCTIDLVAGTIITSHLSVTAKVKGITDADFQGFVSKAEKNCPVSKVLNAAISSTAVLV